MQTILQDLRYGTRVLLKKPGFTLIAYRFAPLSLSHDGINERLWGYVVSGNYKVVNSVNVTPTGHRPS